MRYPKTMPYTEFNTGLCRYKDALRRAYRLKEKGRLNAKEKWARDALDFADKVEKSMMDQGNHNFVRWLKLEKCGFTHPKTGETIPFEIADDHETIYNFLLMCKIYAEGKEPDDGFVSYLAYLLSRADEEGC